ncbi:hypothetical protein M3231_06920 [Neobacillus mesonae]|nr:hypothetical protein [Neobacillus mesonae]
MSANRHIYIVLTSSGTYFSKMIKYYTKAPLNHASISFDADLNEVYSFGRKNAANPFRAGLVREDYSSPFFHSSECAVYCLRVTAEQYERMHGLVKEMMERQHTYKYHLLGLIGVMLHIELPRENAYFCSQFVSYVLNHAGVSPVRKPPHFVKPCDFEDTDMLREVYRGSLAEYTMQTGTLHIKNSSGMEMVKARII